MLRSTLRRLGLDRLLIGNGIVLERIVHTDPSGTVDEVHDLGPANARYAANVGVTRDALITALSSAVRADIRYETTVVAVAGPSAEPEVTFSDGTSARFELVGGADGIDSAVRRI